MNMATWMLSSIDVPWGVGFNTSITPEEVIERYNLNQTASGWTGEEGEVFFGYIYTGIRLLMNKTWTQKDSLSSEGTEQGESYRISLTHMIYVSNPVKSVARKQ